MERDVEQAREVCAAFAPPANLSGRMQPRTR